MPNSLATRNMPPGSKIRSPGGNNFSPAPRGISKIPDTDLSARRPQRIADCLIAYELTPAGSRWRDL